MRFLGRLMTNEKPAGRWRKPAIALGVFLLVSLGIGPKVVDHYFLDAADGVADRLGSVEIEYVALTGRQDPLFQQGWAFGEVSALGTEAVTKAQAESAVVGRAAAVGGMTTRFVVRSNRANDLVITQMRARVVRHAEPLTGTLVLPIPGGGPSPDPIVMARFAVGGPDPRAYDGRDPARLLFADTNLVLKRDESMVLQVTGAAIGCYCEWVVDIELAIGTEVRTVTVPDVATPLRVTAPVPRYQSVYQPPFGAPSDLMTVADPTQACQGDCVVNPPAWQER